MECQTASAVRTRMLKRLRRRFRETMLARWGFDKIVLHGQTSFAQEGEDILLRRILGAPEQRKGIYVDVGSNHPWKFSNTAFLYLSGWSGVAIDPNPDFGPLFACERPRDIFLNVGISDRAQKLIYYRFPESLYNTFSLEKSRRLVESGTMPIPAEIAIETMNLRDALSSVWPNGKTIDLLSIDAEGLDEKIISGHDFERYPAKYVIAEVDSTFVEASRSEPVCTLLRDHGFALLCKLFKSVIFIHRSACAEFGMVDEAVV